MEISHVILQCTDLDRSVAFWGDAVGLDLLHRDNFFAFFDGGGCRLVLNAGSSGAPVESTTEVVLIVPDVFATHEELAGRGVPFGVDPRPVTSGDAGTLFAAHFRDPDGNLASVSGWVQVR